MTPEEYEKFKQSLKETQQKAARTIERMDKTIEGVKDTINQIQENQRNIENFKKQFSDVMTQLAQKIAGSFVANPFKYSSGYDRKIQGKTYDHLPTVLPVKQVVKSMLNHKNILIITGAGVSAPSGIPTFRGKNGLYDKKFHYANKDYQPEQFITKAFYDEHPDPIWQWVEQIYKMATTVKPNKIHQLIDKLARVLSARGRNVTVVTQNVDDLHLKPTKQEYAYYNVHGNVKEVRCDNNHIYDYADFRKEIVTESKRVRCPKCNELLRPHVLFFDESYGPLYGGEVKDKQFSFVFVIGSSLSTGLSTKLTLKGSEVVQINPNPVIEVGRVYQFKGDTVVTLSQFLKELGESK